MGWPLTCRKIPSFAILPNMERSPTASRRVLLVIPANGIDGRARLRGIFRYLNDHPRWETVLITTRTEALGERLPAELAAGCDGLITSAEPELHSVISSAAATGLPTIIANEALQDLSNMSPTCSAVILDDMEIGRTAAAHLLEQGSFASYAYYTVDDRIWSRRRYEGFKKALRPHVVNALLAGTTDEVGWLKSLPKPTAVFASNDLAARRILAFAHGAGIRMPRECNVVGCDNDVLVCQSATPRLTSIKPNFEQVGFVAARTLDRLMDGLPVPKISVVKGCEIIVRESTHGLSPSTQLVRRATEFISSHACRGIGVPDVAAHLHVSRSLLDLRYREVRKTSVFESILDVRLAAVCRELRTTRTPIGKITRLCGFNNPASLKRLFRNRYNMTMREFRNQAGEVPPSAP
ncbi:MAG: substrate-binding domain-containing protein [Kiritimatiellia bacterium]